jgi:CBS domain-containing protein
MKDTQARQAVPTTSPLDPAKTLARDVMRTDVLVLHADDSIRSAAEQLEDAGASGAPVVDEAGKLIGVLTTRDIARGEHVDDAGVSTRIAVDSEPDDASTADAPAFDEEVFATDAFGDAVLGRVRIGDWMTPGITTVDPRATLAYVCRVMIDENIHRVFVVEDDRLLGVVSTQDVVRLLATPPRAR